MTTLILGVAMLAVAYVGLIALARWFAQWGIRREAGRRFEADFIPENADVVAQERALLEARLLTGLEAVERERLFLNRVIRAWVKL